MMISIIHEGLSWKLWSICVGQKHWLEPQIEFPQLLLWQLSHQGHPEMWPQAGIDLVGIPTLKIVGRWNVLINHLTDSLFSPQENRWQAVFSVNNRNARKAELDGIYIHWRKGELLWIFHQHPIDIHRLGRKTDLYTSNFSFQRDFLHVLSEQLNLDHIPTHSKVRMKMMWDFNSVWWHSSQWANYI